MSGLAAVAGRARPALASLVERDGGNDERVNATIPKSSDLMKKAGKTYEPLTYEGAGHGFMRAGEAPDANEANKKAREEAWKRLKDLLRKI